MGIVFLFCATRAVDTAVYTCSYKGYDYQVRYARKLDLVCKNFCINVPFARKNIKFFVSRVLTTSARFSC